MQTWIAKDGLLNLHEIKIRLNVTFTLTSLFFGLKFTTSYLPQIFWRFFPPAPGIKTTNQKNGSLLDNCSTTVTGTF